MFQYLLVMAAIAVPGVLIAIALIVARVLDYRATCASNATRLANDIATARAELAQRHARDFSRTGVRHG